MQYSERKQSLVTVVIPAYNAAEYIGQTLDSVENQTYRLLEVLIVDDGSTDRTSEIVQSFESRDSRFRLIRQKNAGVGAARNRAIREARGEFIAPLDADDVWHPGKIQQQVKCMVEGGPEVGLVYCWSNRINAEGEWIGRTSQVLIEGRVSEWLMLRNFIGCASVPLIRKAALDQVGYYLTRAEQGGGQGCEDRDLYLRIAEVFWIRVVHDHLVDYRQIKKAMSLNAPRMMQSFELVLDRARARNPRYPNKLYRWARGNFYRWLMRKSFLWQMDAWAMICLKRALAADPLFLFSKEGYAIAIRCMVRSCIRRRFVDNSPRPSAAWDGSLLAIPKHNPVNEAFFRKVEARRWDYAGRLQPGREAADVVPEPKA